MALPHVLPLDHSQDSLPSVLLPDLCRSQERMEDLQTLEILEKDWERGAAEGHVTDEAGGLVIIEEAGGKSGVSMRGVVSQIDEIAEKYDA